MNPHFIFNTLNRIPKHNGLKRRRRGEQIHRDFFGAFEKTLDMSATQNVQLTEEINYLKSYITLQELRLNYPVKTTYIIEDEIDLERCEIPALMVQPLIENAILHGISPLKKQGELEVKFSKVKDTLIVEVNDNGVGRKMAQRYKASIKTRDENRPSASKILQDRIDIYNYVQKTNSEFKLEDRVYRGQVVGTKATLKIPKLIDIKAV